jgi:hypothetical protein
MSTQNQTLLHENLNLKEKCQSYDLMLSADTIKLLHLLFIELNACTNDLNGLVTNCIDIYNGKQIDISSLLGFDSSQSVDFNSIDFATSITQATGLINSEFISKKTNEIKKYREKLANVRKLVSDEYADRLGSNISCATQ